MTIEDKDRCVSPKWKLDTLKKATERCHAAAYLKDFWEGWIAAPMCGPGACGGWAQLTLACLAVEATAHFYRPLGHWQALGHEDTNEPGNLLSKKTFCYMFEKIFDGEPLQIQNDRLPDVVYKVFRCGLAHRGLSQDLSKSASARQPKWLGVIDGQGMIFKDLTDQGQQVLSIDPAGFADRVNDWFHGHVLEPLSKGPKGPIDDAFKYWCKQRWDIDANHWNF